MNDDPFQADNAATPLTPDERLDLKLSYVALWRELNEAEALNVLVGERRNGTVAAKNQTPSDRLLRRAAGLSMDTLG